MRTGSWSMASKPIPVFKRSSAACGCFYCLRIFSPQDITQWWEESKNSDLESATAVCPHCGIDAVIGSASGYPITQAFLEKMKGHWFS